MCAGGAETRKKDGGRHYRSTRKKRKRREEREGQKVRHEGEKGGKYRPHTTVSPVTTYHHSISIYAVHQPNLQPHNISQHSNACCHQKWIVVGLESISYSFYMSI